MTLLQLKRIRRINRNIVECKLYHIQQLTSFFLRINRNIVECKSSLPAVISRLMLRINRNIVECKSNRDNCFIATGTEELIETLWNVNNPAAAKVGDCTVELIETLWNVNSNIKRQSLILTGINRNIVECKFIPSAGSVAVYFGINRNIVECKLPCNWLYCCWLIWN